MRKLKTRLGASFGFALIVVFVALFIFVFSESNVSETVSLMPSGSNSLSHSLDDYGRLNIAVRMVGPRPMQSPNTCRDLVDFHPDEGLKCNVSFDGDARKVSSVESPTISCTMHMECIAETSIGGQHDLMLGLPDQFQTIEWALQHEQWDGKEKTSLLQDTIGPKNESTNPATSVGTLAGSVDDPTTIIFGVIRSVVQDNRYDEIDSGCITGGLHLNWRGVNRVQSTEGTESGMHYISFRFLVEETIFYKNLDRKLSTPNRLSVVITYCLTVVGIMHTMKSKLQKIFDKLMIFRAKKLRKEPPEDVQRRIRVLYEHAITERMPGDHRRLSSKQYLRDIEMDDLNDGKGSMESAVSEVENPLRKKLESQSGAELPALLSVVTKMQAEIDKSKREIEEWKTRVENLEKTVARLVKSDSPEKGEQTFTQHTAEDGSVYYCNVVTGESVWELPDGATVK